MIRRILADRRRLQYLTDTYTTGFIQVAAVAACNYFVSRRSTLGVLVAAFLISWMWVRNVRAVVQGDRAARWAYALGASTGAAAGMWAAALLAGR